MIARAPAGGERPALRELWLIGLTALTVLFGMQSLRSLMPLVVFVLRDRFGWSAAAVGLVVLAVLATGFLAAPAGRVAGAGRFLRLTAGGLGAARLAQQLWAGDPLFDLLLAAAASMFFFFALPALAAAAHQAGARGKAGGAGGSFVFGWSVGLAADSALHGAFATWDMSWRSDPAIVVVIAAMVAVQWRLLAAAGVRGGAGGGEIAPGPTWAALGPLLFLELVVLGNVARLTTLSGWQPEWTALWVAGGHILASGAVALVVLRGRLAWWWWSSSSSSLWLSSSFTACALVGSLIVPWPRGAWSAWLQLGGLLLAAVLWASITTAGPVCRHPRRHPWRPAVSHGLGLLGFGALLFLYYAGIDMRLPFSKHLIPPAAALAMGAAAVVAARSGAGASRRPGRSLPLKAGLIGALVAVALLLLPATKLLVRPRAADAATGFPLRIMTYNLHLGVDPWGRLDLEQLAATIEAENPDLVALQEVCRGWVLNGSVDTLGWLSRRLGMSYLFAATADPLWGNALLSRRPILDHQALDLPSEDLLIRRGFLSARIDLGSDGHFEAIVTHHHHLAGGGKNRELQSRAVLDFWQGRGRTAIVGDFNAPPGQPEIELMRRAGLRDVLDLARVEPGFTYSALEPVKRIDYIWVSPDLAPYEVSVPSSPASDHLPVVATLVPRPGRS